MNITVITPPLVQLNSPYPSGAYLTSFFKQLGHNCNWADLSNDLVYSIFSRQGLIKLFSQSQARALQLAGDAQAAGDDNTAFQLRRYISTKANWINWIDDILAILCGRGREKEHQFLFSPFAPRGARMEGFLAGLDRAPTVDDVRFLASYALADLGDYITTVFDPEFSLIRYAEHLTVDDRNFSQIEKNLDSPVMKEFYEPVLVTRFASDGQWRSADATGQSAPQMVCISVPFAGTFLPALYTARWFKKNYPEAYVVIGGGFVNTELRDADDPALEKYIDAISYDRGYGSYKQFFESGAKTGAEKKSLYKLRQFTPSGVIAPLWSDQESEAYEADITSKIIPDYSDIDFSLYPRVCDDENPMHRLWNDGAWIKAYMAHGCYWHKCAFCDTQLDYVCGYQPVAVKNLYDGLLKTAEEKGVYGIHFVDEALPPRYLKDFALYNARKGNKLYFWGNVRFEKSFTKDLAVFLSYCGFGGASAGLEVATGEGLKSINKGVDINSIVSACAAFKEAGILVHAYMIYGFWNDTAQSIINSMETLRQFFESGLLDSAFFHKFVLTRNSQVFYDYQHGANKDLQPILPDSKKSIFADNNLHFKGEEKYNKFGLPLEAAVNAWMHGDKLEMKVTKWFDFQVPSPTIPKDFLEKAIAKYEEESNKTDFESKEPFWLGSTPTSAQGEYTWLYLQEELAAPLTPELVETLTGLTPQTPAEVRNQYILKIKKSPDLQKQLKRLHNKGLVLV